MSDEATLLSTLMTNGRWKKADVTLLRWLDKHPEDLHALGNFADAQMRQANHGLAINLYRYLLMSWEDMPAEVRPLIWANMGQALYLEGFKEAGELAFSEAEKLNPREPGVYNAIAGCYINQGQPDRVIEYCNKALECEPDLPQALWNRSIGYLEKGDWERGWPGYEEGDRKLKHRSYKEGDPMRQWDGKRNRCVVVWGEQGVGDEVMFASCLPDVIAKCKEPIFDCHPRLERTFKRSFPGIPVYGTRKSGSIDWHHKHKIDSQIAVGSLPKLYRKSTADCPGTPYLKADPERIAHYRAELEKLGPPPYVGIAWFGGEKRTRFDYRQVPLEQWTPIRDTGCTFTSLQYDKWKHNLEADKHALHQFPEANSAEKDLDDQMALIMACDLVITVAQSVVHFAGALGRECWVLTPARPSWPFRISGEHMPWYGNTVTLFRQKEGEDWRRVIQTVTERLHEFRKHYREGAVELPAGGAVGVGTEGQGRLGAVAGG